MNSARLLLNSGVSSRVGTIRPFIRSVLLYLVLACAATGQTMAAETENTGSMGAHAPRGAWTVGPIKALSENKISYCSMKNRYAGGHTVIFARDANGSSSLAFDLGRRELQPGRQYPVQIDVGVLTRNLVGVAATDDVLIVQLGADKPFFDMVSQQAEMRVLSGERQNFYGLEGAADALQSLAICADAQAKGETFKPVQIALKPLTGILEATGGISNDPATFASPSRYKLPSLSEQVIQDGLKEEIEILRAQNRKLLLENQKMSALMLGGETAMRGRSLGGGSVIKVHPRGDTSRRHEGPAVEAVPVESVSSAALPPLPTKAAANGLTLSQTVSALKQAGYAPTLNEAGDYVWSAGGIDGSLYRFPVSAVGTDAAHPAEAFQGFIDEVGRQCEGDFAQKVSSGGKVFMAEIACMDGESRGIAAALAGVAIEGGEMAVASFEAQSEEMLDALDARDAVATRLAAVTK